VFSWSKCATMFRFALPPIEKETSRPSQQRKKKDKSWQQVPGNRIQARRNDKVSLGEKKGISRWVRGGNTQSFPGISRCDTKKKGGAGLLVRQKKGAGQAFSNEGGEKGGGERVQFTE